MHNCPSHLKLRHLMSPFQKIRLLVCLFVTVIEIVLLRHENNYEKNWQSILVRQPLTKGQIDLDVRRWLQFLFSFLHWLTFISHCLESISILIMTSFIMQQILTLKEIVWIQKPYYTWQNSIKLQKKKQNNI